MNSTKNKSKIALPPIALNSPAMLEVIDKGGTVKEQTLTTAKQQVADEDPLKSFTFKIYESELAQIRDIQARLPKRDRISIHDFVVAAVKDKINKNLKK